MAAVLDEGALGRRPELADPLTGSLPSNRLCLCFLAGLPYTGCLTSQSLHFPSAEERVQIQLSLTYWLDFQKDELQTDVCDHAHLFVIQAPESL